MVIPGGFCFGKSRLGFETQRIPQAIFEASSEFGSLPTEEKSRLLEAMADPIYIYIDFGNGQQFEKALDWHDDQAVLAAVRLGVRLACRGLCGVSLPSLLTYGWEACLELDTVRVLSQIVREALAKRGVTQGDGGGGDREVNQARTKPPVCVIIHLDEFQLYIQRAAHVQGGDMNEGREYFKDMVRTILDFMKNVSPSQLGGECFVLPLCTGTLACDITFLPTESNRKTVSMAPLTAASVDAMAVEYYGQEFSNHLTNVRWKMAVGDSMGIPRFVEWMLLGRRDAWSDTLSNEIQAKEALQDLANYGGPDGAERLIALALVRKPVSRTFSLGDSIGTIGELERPGTFYLVPVSSVAGMYYVEIPLPVCRTMCMQLEKIGKCLAICCVVLYCIVVVLYCPLSSNALSLLNRQTSTHTLGVVVFTYATASLVLARL